MPWRVGELRRVPAQEAIQSMKIVEAIIASWRERAGSQYRFDFLPPYVFGQRASDVVQPRHP